MFKEYKSKPIVREAYQIRIGDDIEIDDDGDVCVTVAWGEVTTYLYCRPTVGGIHAGGWMVKDPDGDCYYCPNKLFEEKNIV